MAVIELSHAAEATDASWARAETDLALQRLALEQERRAVTEPLKHEVRVNHFALLASRAMRGRHADGG